MSSSVRAPSAPHFYPSSGTACVAALRDFEARVDLPTDLPARPLGGLVPHAGWVYSGHTAAHLWLALARAEQPPEVVVLLGAVHVHGVPRACVYSGSAWTTPLGPIQVDVRLAADLVAASDGVLVAGTAAHDGEHSLEVQVPFVRHLLPDVPVVPIAVPANTASVDVGHAIARTVAADGRRIAVVASSDLTHYGPRYGFAPVGTGLSALRWSRDNDTRMIDRAIAFDAEGVLGEAASHHNACGSGALAASLSATHDLGARSARLLQQTTSYEVRPSGSPDLFVGYASVLFA